MAGENILPTEHYPDDFQTTTIYVPGIASGASVPLLYVDPRLNAGGGIVLDRADIVVQTVSGTASATVTLQKSAVADGSSATALAAAADIKTAVGILPQTLVATENFIPSGSMLFLKASAHDSTAARLLVQLRWRSRLK